MLICVLCFFSNELINRTEFNCTEEYSYQFHHTMGIYDDLLSDLKKAMLARDNDRVRVLRSIKAALLEKEISERVGGQAKLSEEQVVQVLMKSAKQRRESIEQFEEHGRLDLANAEKEELEVIESYLPKMMNEDEITSVADETIKTVGATSPQDMGKVMGAIMPKVKGKADGALVSRIVKERLNTL